MAGPLRIFAAAAAAVVLLALAAGAAAQMADTTGKALPHAPSYAFSSNVASYAGVSSDVCDFKAALDSATPNFAAAKALYNAGKNSKKSDGSMRTFKGLAVSTAAGDEPFANIYSAHFGSPSYIQDFVDAGFGGTTPLTTPQARAEALQKTVEGALILSYFMHELDEAGAKIKAKQVDDKSGAPHNVDEAVMLYFGGSSPDCSLAALSTKRAKAFGTLATCSTSKANEGVAAALNAARAAARKGDAAAFDAAYKRIASLVAATFAQGTLEYAEKLEAARKAGKPTDGIQGEAYGFFRAIEPLVAAADKGAAAAVAKAIAPGAAPAAGVNAQVAAALGKAYKGLGITAADVGAYGAASAVKC